MLQKFISTIDKLLFSNLKLVDNLWINRFFKLAWIIAVTVSCSGLIFYLNEAYKKWHVSPDISTSVKLISSREIPFPAITICHSSLPAQTNVGSLNPYSYFYSAQYGEILANFTQNQQNFMGMIIQTCYPNFAEIAMKLLTNRSETNIMTLFQKATYNVRVVKCEFSNVIYNCFSLVTYSYGDSGHCLTFNMQGYNLLFNTGILSKDFDIYNIRFNSKPKYNITLANGTKSAIDMDKIWNLEQGFQTSHDSVLPARAIKINSFAFFSRVTGPLWSCINMNTGLKLIVHMPNEIPTPFHGNQFVDMIRGKKFKISAKIHRTSEKMRSYPPKIRLCYFEGEKRLKFFKSYTKAQCDFECMTNYTLKHCGCVKFDMPRTANTTICDIDKVDCYYQIARKWPIINESNCDCYSPCTDLEYNFEVERDNIISDQIGNFDGENSETFFKVSFIGHVVEEHTNYIAYGIQNFIADSGGLIGLFLGFSLLSIYELLQDFVGLIFSQFCSCRKLLKLLWIVAVALSFCGFAFYSYEAYRKWQIEPDISIKISQISSREIPLPAMTICHTLFPSFINKLFRNSEYKKFGFKMSNITASELENAAAFGQICDFDGIRDNFTINQTNLDVITLIGYAKYDLIFYGCSFRGIQHGTCEKNLDHLFTDDGMCKTFNSQGYKSILRENYGKAFEEVKNKKIAKFPHLQSPLYNVTIADNAEVNWTLSAGYKSVDDEILPIRSLSYNVFGVYIGTVYASPFYCYETGKGFKVYFHLPNEIVTPFHKHSFVNLHNEQHFTINAIKYTTSEKMQNYRPEVRLCYFKGERKLKFYKSYTKALCEYECLTNYTLQQCGCVKFAMPHSSEMKVCGIDKINCYEEIKRSWPSFGVNSTDVSESCKCLKPCTNIEYMIDVEKEGPYVTVLSKYVSYIKMYFKNHIVDERMSYIAYTLQNFVADCGGLIGLFIGFSLLSIFEFVCETVLVFMKKKNQVSDTLFKKKSHAKIVIKILWVIAVIFSLIGLIFYSYQALNKWYISPEITTRLKQIPSREIPMPAVTICDSLFPEELALFKHPQTIINNVAVQDIVTNLTALEQSYIALILHTCCPIHYPKLAQKICTNRSETDIVKLLKNATSMSMFDYCSFRNIDVECRRVLHASLTDHGICHTINMQDYNKIFNEGILSSDFNIFKSNNSDSSDVEWTLQNGYTKNDDDIYPIRALKHNIITLVLNFDKTKPRRWYCGVLGGTYKLIFHLPNEVPTLFHKSHFVYFFSKKVLKINAKISKITSLMHNYPPKVRRCYLEGEKKLRFFKSYTKTLCDYECMTNFTLQQCGCVKFSMPRDQFTKVCDMDKIECYMASSVNWADKTSEICKCLQPCTDIEYSVNTESQRDATSSGHGNTLFEYEFAKNTIDEQTSYVAYNLQNFIADCGGLIGLFLGFSLLSIFELLCNFLTYCIRKFMP